MFQRRLRLPPAPHSSFFLWGPRQTGKSSLLRATYPDGYWVDLLKTDVFAAYTARPHALREEILAMRVPPFVVLDEVQRVPALLDEVHWLIENRGVRFALCGSSARKVRRGHANLLGGRAIRHELFGLVSAEIGTDFELVRALNHGFLPRHYLADDPLPLLRAYVGDYLKEEIAAEGLVRNLPTFASFLEAAAIGDTEMVSYATVARDCGVSAPTVRGHYEILVDTLLGRWLPAYTKRPKRRVIASPKFYFADVGVVNVLARRRGLEPGGPAFGKAFESWVFHELSAHRAYTSGWYDVAYWRLASGIEVDFVVDDVHVAIDAKATPRVTSDHLRGLRELRRDHPAATTLVVVSLEPRPRRTDDGIDVLPAVEFARRLWADELIAA